MSALPVVLSHNLLCLILCTEGTTFMKIGNNFCTDSRSCLYFTQSCHTSLWDKIVLNGVKPHKAVGVRQSDMPWGAEAAFLMGIKTLSIYFASLENHFSKYRLEIPTLPLLPGTSLGTETNTCDAERVCGEWAEQSLKKTFPFQTVLDTRVD